MGEIESAKAPVREQVGFVGFEGQDALLAAADGVAHLEGLGRVVEGICGLVGRSWGGGHGGWCL